MDILIIAENIGLTAPGIVYERLISGLSKHHDIDVLTTTFNGDHKICNNIYIQEYNKLRSNRVNYHVDRLQIGLISVNIFDVLWAKKAKTKITKRYDIIFSFISFSHYLSLVAGYEIAKNGSKLLIYSVDAIPPPSGWLSDSFLINGTNKMLKKYFSSADAFFSSNEAMLNYQLRKFNFKWNLISGVIYTPGPNKEFNLPYDKIKNPVFLYTGGIYGPRKPSYLLNAFKKILKLYPKAKLEFIGTKIDEIHFENFTLEERNHIIFHPFTKDLRSYYERSTALIDIDADLPYDVFLSSKITNYIYVNRIIISETGLKSPSRRIFKDIPSIFQCNHNEVEIKHAMIKAIDVCKSMNYDDRENIKKMFDIKTIVDRLNIELKKLQIPRNKKDESFNC